MFLVEQTYQNNPTFKLAEFDYVCNIIWIPRCISSFQSIYCFDLYGEDSPAYIKITRDRARNQNIFAGECLVILMTVSKDSGWTLLPTLKYFLELEKHCKSTQQCFKAKADA